MAAVNGMLVLIGGMDIERKLTTNQISNWDKRFQRWMKELPPMVSARQDCSVVAHKKWFLVAGGSNHKMPIDNVELLNLSTMQWQVTRPLPKPSVGMTSCVINNTCYLLGGTNFTEPLRGGETGPKEYVFSLNLDDNIFTNKWVQLPNTPFYCSTAVSFGDYVMALGGTDSLTSNTYGKSMFVYSPVSRRWLYVGDMPTARSMVTCVVISQGCIVVIGGQQRGSKYSRLMEILHC